MFFILLIHVRFCIYWVLFTIFTFVCIPLLIALTLSKFQAFWFGHWITMQRHVRDLALTFVCLSLVSTTHIFLPLSPFCLSCSLNSLLLSLFLLHAAPSSNVRSVPSFEIVCMCFTIQWLQEWKLNHQMPSQVKWKLCAKFF